MEIKLLPSTNTASGVSTLCSVLLTSWTLRMMAGICHSMGYLTLTALLYGFAGQTMAANHDMNSGSSTKPKRQTIPVPAPKPVAPQTKVIKVDCGARWTDWIEVGNSARNPCPANCYSGAVLGQSYRSVGYPRKTQIRYRFQCWKYETVTTH